MMARLAVRESVTLAGESCFVSECWWLVTGV
jgi:hypothetical protein